MTVNDLVNISVSNAVAATILALIALVLGAVYRRPAVVHGLWLLVLLKLVTPPLVHIPIAWPGAAEPAALQVVATEEPPEATPAPEEPATAIPPFPAAESDVPAVEPLPATDPVSPSPVLPAASLWPQVLQIVWGAGSLAWFLLALARLDHFRRLLRFAQPASAALQERTRRLARSLGLARCPRVRLLPGRLAPMLWAAGGPPRLLVPADLLAVLSDEQLDTLLVHELAHLRRRDHWVRILEFVVMGLYWWHPVVWCARRELREAEEQCCDAWVVSTLPGAGRTYASALLDTLDFLSTAPAVVPPLASGLGQIVDLKRRLTMIMRGTTPRSLTWPGCLGVVALGLTFLPMVPALSGQAPSQEEAEKSVADEQEAKRALDAAKANLELQRAALEQRQAEVELAAVKLKEAQVQRQQAIRSSIQTRGPVIEEDEVEKKATYRIEITLPADGSVNAKEIVEKIKKVLPEELRSSIFFRPVPVTVRLQPVHPGSQVGLGNSSDKRINDLEKKLEKVLQELRDLRKQMKEPRPRSSATPPPVPAN
jgi:beta-lactamase regulating signal transducer with metallopeptidase domain